MTDSPIVQQVKELEDKKTYAMTGKEVEQYQLICTRLEHARNQRTMNRDEFDGMTYEQAYLTNQRANMSYLAPKLNNDDVRVNTGTAEKKVEFVQNELLALNLQNEILAYDRNDVPMLDVSEMLTDVVHRTEQMELADDKDLYIIGELLSQPCVYVEELWVEKKVRGKKGKFRTVKQCERRLVQGPQIYLGDMNMPAYRFNDQPFIFKYFRMTYNEAKTEFGDMDRWDYVHQGAYGVQQPPPYQVYRKGALMSNEVEGWFYMSAPDNEFQLILQGVPMFEVGESLPWDWTGYNIIMEGLKPYHGDFAYFKSLIAAGKTLQALDNEMIRNLVRKFRQAIEPPTGTPTGKVYSRDIWSPGSMVQGVTKDMFSKLIDHNGVTTSEMEMYKLIEEKIDEFIGRPQVVPEGNPTATQIVSEQREAAKMLGLAVLAASRLKSKEGMLRAHNIIQNYTKSTGSQLDPVSKQVRATYAQFTLQNADLGDGKQGTKMIQFGDNTPSEDMVGAMYAHEQKQLKAGTPVKLNHVNVDVLKDLELNFHAIAVPKPKDSRELEKVMLGDELVQAGNLSALIQRPLNADKAVEKFERVWQSKDLFEKSGPGPGMAPGASPLPSGAPGQPAPLPQAPAGPQGAPKAPMNQLPNAPLA